MLGTIYNVCINNSNINLSCSSGFCHCRKKTARLVSALAVIHGRIHRVVHLWRVMRMSESCVYECFQPFTQSSRLVVVQEKEKANGLRVNLL